MPLTVVIGHGHHNRAICVLSLFGLKYFSHRSCDRSGGSNAVLWLTRVLCYCELARICLVPEGDTFCVLSRFTKNTGAVFFYILYFVTQGSFVPWFRPVLITGFITIFPLCWSPL